MLSESITEQRKLRNITQVDLAKALGVSKQCVSNWENDYVQPSIDMLIRLSNYFSVSTDFLLGLNNKTYLEVTGLTPLQLLHIQQIVNDLSEQ